MVLGSFQCRGILLLWHMTGHECAAVLAAGGRRMGCLFVVVFFLVFFFFFFFCFCFCFLVFFSISSILSFFPNGLSLGRRPDMTELLWCQPLQPYGSCQLLPDACSLRTG